MNKRFIKHIAFLSILLLTATTSLFANALTSSQVISAQDEITTLFESTAHNANLSTDQDTDKDPFFVEISETEIEESEESSSETQVNFLKKQLSTYLKIYILIDSDLYKINRVERNTHFFKKTALSLHKQFQVFII